VKFLTGVLVVFMIIGIVSGPAMACGGNCGGCSDNGGCSQGQRFFFAIKPLGGAKISGT
jgi:hypothetical protein